MDHGRIIKDFRLRAHDVRARNNIICPPPPWKSWDPPLHWCITTCNYSFLMKNLHSSIRSNNVTHELKKKNSTLFFWLRLDEKGYIFVLFLYKVEGGWFFLEISFNVRTICSRNFMEIWSACKVSYSFNKHRIFSVLSRWGKNYERNRIGIRHLLIWWIGVIQRRRSWGAVAPTPLPPMKILGWKIYRFAPPPPIISTTWKFMICRPNARISLKSTVSHYKTIKFNIKNSIKLVKFSILRAKFYNCDFTRGARRKFWHFPYSCLPPPIQKMDPRPWRLYTRPSIDTAQVASGI